MYLPGGCFSFSMINPPGTSTAETRTEGASGPSLPPMFARYRDDLDREVSDTVSGTPAASEVHGLYSMLRYHMGWADADGNAVGSPSSQGQGQGKGLRPTLCLFACEVLGDGWAGGLPAAAALELIHNFSLIHDDIQDGDVERRHRPTVWSVWGQPQALVAGNAMRSLADLAALRLTRCGVSPEKAVGASLLLTNGYLEMTMGQCSDLAFEGRLDISLDDYLQMVSWKTGALIRCGMEMGALIASDDPKEVQAFSRCGSRLGRAFQIRDDILGIWGDEGSTGKSVGNDIRRKKKSFPVVYALEVAHAAAREKLMDAYSRETLDDGCVLGVLGILDELNVLGYAERVTREQAQLALKEVDSVSMPGWAREEIRLLAEFLAARLY